MWSRRNSVCSESRPKAFDMSSGIPKLPITSRSVDNIYNRVLCCKSISINYKMHGWFLYWQHATGWVWWKSGLRAVAMWSSSSFTKSKSVNSGRVILHHHFRYWSYTYKGSKLEYADKVMTKFGSVYVSDLLQVSLASANWRVSPSICAKMLIKWNHLCVQLHEGTTRVNNLNINNEIDNDIYKHLP